jgi:agmatinase
MHRVLVFSALAAQLLTPASSSPVNLQCSFSDKDRRNRQKEQYNLEPDANYAFSGITTFHQLPIANCLSADYSSAGTVDDILVVGLPFDTATSYRSGTRFGPNAIRQGSRANSLAYVFCSPQVKRRTGFASLKQSSLPKGPP